MSFLYRYVSYLTVILFELICKHDYYMSLRLPTKEICPVCGLVYTTIWSSTVPIKYCLFTLRRPCHWFSKESKVVLEWTDYRVVRNQLRLTSINSMYVGLVLVTWNIAKKCIIIPAPNIYMSANLHSCSPIGICSNIQYSRRIWYLPLCKTSLGQSILLALYPRAPWMSMTWSVADISMFISYFTLLSGV